MANTGAGRGIGVDIFTQGKTLDELMVHIREAVELHFEEELGKGESIRILSISETEVGTVPGFRLLAGKISSESFHDWGTILSGSGAAMHNSSVSHPQESIRLLFPFTMRLHPEH